MDAPLKILASIRTQTGKPVEKLRKTGKIPAVLYGHNVKNALLTLDKKEFEGVFAKSGESTLVNLYIASEPPRTVLVHDVQHHFLKDEITHVDFYEVKMTEKIKAKVLLVFTGEARAVKDLGGVLVKNLLEVEVESLPGDLPHSLVVDISKLNSFEDVILVSDLVMDAEKVKLLARPEEVIVKVTPPRTEEELAALEEKPVEEVSAVEGVVEKAPEPEEESAEASQTKAE